MSVVGVCLAFDVGGCRMGESQQASEWKTEEPHALWLSRECRGRKNVWPYVGVGLERASSRESRACLHRAVLLIWESVKLRE